MFNVYLDDVRGTPAGFDIRTYSVSQTIDFLRHFGEEVDVLSLDNDLGEEGRHTEGLHIPLWLAEMAAEGRGRWPRRIRIHSANPVARDYMRGVIERYGPYRWDSLNQEFVDDSRM